VETRKKKTLTKNYGSFQLEGLMEKAADKRGDAHGHGPPCVTSGERTLLSARLKQGRDWLML
jgi:hypothetical protein